MEHIELKRKSKTPQNILTPTYYPGKTATQTSFYTVINN